MEYPRTTALVDLTLADNAIPDLDALADMAALETLRLSGNKIVDLAPLSGLKALRVLHLFDNEVVSVTPLAGTTALQALSVSNNPVASLAGLEDLPALLELYVSNADLTALVATAPSSLFHLEADGNAITSLAPLAGHEVLHSVFLANNAITSLAPLQNAPWLTNMCAVLNLPQNPLDAATLAVVLPALCNQQNFIQWDPDMACEPDAPMCQLGDP